MSVRYGTTTRFLPISYRCLSRSKRGEGRGSLPLTLKRLGAPNLKSLYLIKSPLWPPLKILDFFKYSKEAFCKKKKSKLPWGSRKKNPPLKARPLRPYPPPPRAWWSSELKSPKTDFDNFFSPHNFLTKIFLEIIVTPK